MFPDRKLFDQLLKRHNLTQALPAKYERFLFVCVAVLLTLRYFSVITDPAFGVLVNLFMAHRVLVLEVIRGEPPVLAAGPVSPFTRVPCTA